MRKRRSITRRVAWLCAGAVLLQLGPCFNTGAGVALTAFNPGLLLDENETFFGILAPCGDPNWQLIDQDGNPVGNLQNSEDDLIYGCPTTLVVQTGDGG